MSDTEPKFPNEPAKLVPLPAWEGTPPQNISVPDPLAGPGMRRYVQFEDQIPSCEPAAPAAPPSLARVLDDIRLDDATQEPARGNDRER
jgi:hypothetical protein